MKKENESRGLLSFEDRKGELSGSYGSLRRSLESRTQGPWGCPGTVMPSEGELSWRLLKGPEGSVLRDGESCGDTGHSPKRAIGTIYLIHIIATPVAYEPYGARAK